MRARGTLKRRISRAFLLQATAISVAAIVSVLLAAAVIKRVLVTEALRMEADYFWTQRAVVPEFPPPDTRNLSAYLAVGPDAAGVPLALRGLPDGFHEIPSAADVTTVYVDSRDGDRLFLAFDGERVDELAAYFGLVPLVVVLLVLYLSVWFAYRASHRAVSPIAWLAREVNRLDPDRPSPRRIGLDQLPAEADQEIEVLAAALSGLANRLDAFVERERTFTRDASHELRTPLTVIRMATDLLLARPDLDAAARSGVQRIRRSSDEMEQLVEAFLLLAREADQGLPQALICLNDLVRHEIDALEPLVKDKPVVVRVEAQGRLSMQEPEQAVSAVVRNLLRNAVSYTDEGEVLVRIDRHGLVISDSGVGMDPEEASRLFEPYVRGSGQQGEGHGVGLTIVRRFCDRFQWNIRFDTSPGRGTRVQVGFPNAVFRSSPGDMA
jgi:signal transduction histidine kinase